jgi:hypothetical protein
MMIPMMVLVRDVEAALPDERGYAFTWQTFLTSGIDSEDVARDGSRTTGLGIITVVVEVSRI